MMFTRRHFLGITSKILCWVGLSLAPGSLVAAKQAGDGQPTLSATSTDLQAAIARETGGQMLVESEQIWLEAPEIAENGAIVPISVDTSLPGVTTLALFVEKNPTPLAARFQFDRKLEAYVALRIKMNESSDLVAVVNAGGTFYSARKKVNVVLGGCG